MASRRLCTAGATSFHPLPEPRRIHLCLHSGWEEDKPRLWPCERSPSLPGVYIIITLPAAVTAAVIDQRAVRQQNHPNEYLIQFQPRIDPTLCLFILAVILLS